METLVAFIGKGKPFFDRVARNKYLKAIKDGFISAMPVVVFSSLFLLIVAIPEIWGYKWPDDVSAFLIRPYSYSMGILGLLVAATTAKHFTDTLNRDMPKTNQINSTSTMLASIVGFLLLASDDVIQTLNETVTGVGFNNAYLGSKGLLCAFVTAFVVGHIYQFMIRNNITFKLPEQCPPNISQTFKDILPFAATTVVFWLFDYFFRGLFSMSFAEGMIAAFQPLFTAADTYGGTAVIYGAMAFFWFVGVHGPSIVEPAISAVAFTLVADNLAATQAGVHATGIITPGTQYFVACMGGTGATLIITFMFAFMAKSVQNRAVGRAAIAPVCFGVNEPILFGAPMVLNPVFFIPFIFAPIANVWLFKFFVEVLGMNSFTYVLPWPTPAPIGIFLGCGLQVMSLVFFACVCVLDFVIYYPFFKIYDKEVYEQEQAQEAKNEIENKLNEAEKHVEKVEAEAVENAVASGEFDSLAGKKVLVLCAGGGTSGLLANALNNAAKERGLDLEATAGGYGSHMDIMPDYDLVILAPQVASYLPDLEKDAERFNVATAACGGKEYIDLTHDGNASLMFVSKALK